ncbi:GNAT family N-acetyltransferase [Bacillus methanolicus]|uniref:GNAT family N-acetyltransferase n=1 Tax=Bacillus methanolicus TaxID=1471 RepID=UPI00237FE7E1|nr:GNAT family N-acetyltransferase [Bacillus methanolicus]MDE3838857.1 GNAT family N-acetyltransferase [Bacillus methanolicus]
MAEQYRLATLSDAEELLYLTHRAYAPVRELGLPFPAATASLEMVQDNIYKNAVYVAEDNSEMIATITIIYPWGPTHDSSGLPYLWWFAVEPERKKQGIGSRLLTWIEETILRDTLKAPAVTLATSIYHPWLIPMYERRGYEKVKKVELENDTVYFLRKVLNHELLKELTEKESVS